MQIPVKVNGKDVQFLIDSGIGPTVLSRDFVEELSLNRKGTMIGKRMSGQELELPLVKVESIEVGDLLRENLEVGVFDTSGFPPVLKDIKGILSIGFFKGVVLTMDYSGSFLLVTENGPKESSFGDGAIVPVEIEYDGPSVTVYLKVRLPGGKVGKFEVDTGSDVIILSSKLMGELGIKPNDPDVESIRGTDETGHNYERFLTEMKGEIALEDFPGLMQKNPKVIFQDIIHEGLIGHDFLKRYIVSYNIDEAQMIFYNSKNESGRVQSD